MHREYDHAADSIGPVQQMLNILIEITDPFVHLIDYLLILQMGHFYNNRIAGKPEILPARYGSRRMHPYGLMSGNTRKRQRSAGRKKRQIEAGYYAFFCV